MEIDNNQELYLHVNGVMIERLMGVPRALLTTEFPGLTHQWDRIIDQLHERIAHLQHEIDRRSERG